MSVLGPNASMHRLPLLATFNWTLTLRLLASSFDHKEDLGKRCTHGCHRESSAFTWCSAGICGLTEGSCLWSDLLRSLQRSCCHWEWWGGSSTTKKPRVNTEGWTGHYDQFSDKVWSKIIYNLWPTFCPLDSGLLPQAVERLWSSSSSVVPRHQHSFDGWIIKSQTELFDFVVSCGQRPRRYIDMVSSWVQGRRSP